MKSQPRQRRREQVKDVDGLLVNEYKVYSCCQYKSGVRR